MRSRIFGLALGLALPLTATTAEAVPISFVVDPGSSLQVSLSNVFWGTGSGTASVTGGIEVDLTGGVLALNGPSSLQLSDLDVADGTWSGAGILANARLPGWVAELGMGGGGPVGEGNPGEYDLSGWNLTMVAGEVYLLDLSPNLALLDWGGLQFGFEVPITSALATLDTSGGLASFLIPISATATFMTGGNVATLNLGGTITLTEVPEPGTLALVSVGIVALLLKRRQRG